MLLHTTRAKCIAILLVVVWLVSCSAPVTPTVVKVTDQPRPTPQARTRVPAATGAPSEPTTPPLPKIERPIIWYISGESSPDLALINEQLNRELALRRFNAQVEIRVLSSDHYAQEMAQMIKEGQDFDLWTLDAASYREAAENDQLLPLSAYPNPSTGALENLLRPDNPELWNSLPETVWRAVERSGETFAIPNQTVWVKQRGFSIRSDVVAALNLQADLDNIQTYADLTPLFAKILAAIQDGTLESAGILNAKNIETVFGSADLFQPDIAGYDVLAMPFVTRSADPDLQALNWYATSEFQALAELRREWQLAGFAPAETLAPDEIVAGYQAGEFIVEVGRPVWAGSALEQSARYGYTWLDKAISPAFLPSSAPFASLTGIHSTAAADPERVHRIMLLLTWLHTDPQLYNLLAFGREGDHWTWADRNQKIIRSISGSRYHPDFADQLGDRTLSYTLNPQPAGFWEAIRQANTDAPVSQAVGFSFDASSVAAETAAIQSLLPEWLDSLANGEIRNVPSYIERMNQDLTSAGLNAIQAQLAEQLEAWKNKR